MKNLTIGQVANKAEVNPSTIRYYESIGLLPYAERVGSKRQYSNDILNRIYFIKGAQRAGFMIDEIRTLLSGFEPHMKPSERWRTMAIGKIKELDEMVQQIHMMQRVLKNGLRCDCLTWDDCLIKLTQEGTCCE